VAQTEQDKVVALVSEFLVDQKLNQVRVAFHDSEGWNSRPIREVFLNC
jgi:hypothetical protein